MARKSIYYSIEDQIDKSISEFEYASISPGGLFGFLEEELKHWDVKQPKDLRTSFKSFKNYLLAKKKLNTLAIRTPSGTVNMLYIKPNANMFSVASGLDWNAFLSHYSAMHLHGLTLQIPKTFYLNKERNFQSSDYSSGVLHQENIDYAFSKSQRLSEKYYSFDGKRILILIGKYNNQLGIIKKGEKGEKYDVTDLERTLIDIVVRPSYSGGIFEVLEAYKKAKDKVDVIKLLAYLDKMNFIYPYHQSIGLFMEKAGYDQSILELIGKKEKNFDFYISYNIKIKEYSKKWRVYYPKGF
jgi:predicted transcriptional regulator of viral defense system